MLVKPRAQIAVRARVDVRSVIRSVSSGEVGGKFTDWLRDDQARARILPPTDAFAFAIVAFKTVILVDITLCEVSYAWDWRLHGWHAAIGGIGNDAAL